ncbi:MAG: HIT family protein [Patescibacteria group bacterium]
MSDCVFCKIITKEIPAAIVYEDEQVMAFLDMKPVNPGHVLVVPKTHVADLLSAQDAELEASIRVVQRVGKALVAGLGVRGFNLGVNTGAVAGQVVPHLHFHVMPRHEGDGLELWHGKPYASDEEKEKTAETIRAAFRVL